MTQIMSKKNSIYFQLLRQLVLSALISAAVFAGLDYGVSCLISSCFENPQYVEGQNRKYAQKLQKYVDRQGLSMKDGEALSQWVKKQNILYVQIYKDNILVFDSAYPEEEIWEEEIAARDYELDYHSSVNFSDGTGEVYMIGGYAYQYYNYALAGELLLCFGLFLVLVLYGIRRKMAYILQLRDEIEILEGGSLDYPITIKGKDELAALASGLDNMRKSFAGLIEQEGKMVQENQRIITEMSHDLRTPVTSIILYTEILKKGTYKDLKQQREYIEKIDQKARRMKQLTDHLFEYSLITGEKKTVMEEPELYEVLFYDLFSETCSYLNQKGFQVRFQVEWLEAKIRISTEYLLRIMDNITSNLVKYADPAFPVVISSAREGHMAGFTFENHVRSPKEEVESSGIGIQSMKNMTHAMGGRCVEEGLGDLYRLTVLFPIIEEQET